MCLSLPSAFQVMGDEKGDAAWFVAIATWGTHHAALCLVLVSLERSIVAVHLWIRLDQTLGPSINQG